MQIFVRIDGAAGEVTPLLARETVMREAANTSVQLTAEVVAANAPLLLPADADKDDVLVLISNSANWSNDIAAQFPGNIKRLTYDMLLNNPKAILQVGDAAPAEAPRAPVASGAKNIVAVTSCPTGIAHTFMAAEGLSEAAKALGYNIRVETQGSVGAGTPLTAAEIAQADLVIIAADREVDLARFKGKKLFKSGTKPAINDGQNLIKQAFEKAVVQSGAASEAENANTEKKGVYKHLMTGVSFMLPFVVAGGLLIALAFAIGGIYAGDHKGTFAYVLKMIGGDGGFALMVPVLAGYIAFSIADRPGIAPGMIGGLLATQIGSGFLGGIVAGFIAGYSVLLFIKLIKLPKDLQGLMPVLILPLLGTLVTGLLMYYVIGTPVAYLLNFLTEWLKSLQGANAIVVGAVIGGMMALDMGGPVNKAAYATSVALVGSNVYGPMAAAMIAGMTPPMALAVACWLFPSRFTADERNSKISTFILGLAFISEGAIPFAARDPLRVIPSLVIGSAAAGSIAMGLGVGSRAPHGGIFSILIPEVIVNANVSGYVMNLLMALIPLVVGTILSAVIVGILKKPVVKAVAA